ncbi:MAG: copper chaperone PCu(A)C [Sphingobium sp.]
MRAALSLFALAAPFALSACGDPKPTYVDQAYVRLSPNPDSPSAGYFVAHGGDSGAQLRGVLTDSALKVEMHETVSENGMTTMKPVDNVDVPAGQSVAFTPGGRHLMLWGVNQAAVDQGKITLTFLFSTGDRILVDAAIRKPGPQTSDQPAH